MAKLESHEAKDLVLELVEKYQAEILKEIGEKLEQSKRERKI